MPCLLRADCFWKDFLPHEKKFNFKVSLVGGLKYRVSLLGVPLISVFIGDFCKDKSLSFGSGLSTKTKALLFLSCGLGREDCKLVQEKELNHNSRHHGAAFPLQAGPFYGSYGIECSPKCVIQF